MAEWRSMPTIRKFALTWLLSRARFRSPTDFSISSSMCARSRKSSAAKAALATLRGVKLARLDPPVDRPAAHLEAPRQLRLRDASLQLVPREHPRLPAVYPNVVPSLLAKPPASNDVRPAESPNMPSGRFRGGHPGYGLCERADSNLRSSTLLSSLAQTVIGTGLRAEAELEAHASRRTPTHRA